MSQALLAAFWLPDAASRNADQHDPLFYFILGVNIFFSSLIMAILIYFVFKYRHRENKPHNPTAGHSTALELTWTIIPTMIVLVIFYYGFRGYLHANPPTLVPNADTVTANAAMWSWTFTYSANGGDYTDPELHLVVDKPTNIILQSADVIHDLDVPAFRMKKDAVPGRYNREWFEPTVISAPPKPVVSWQTGKVVPSLRTTEDGGYYGLFKGSEEFATNSIDLSPGETFGFETQPNGKTVAVFNHNGGKSIWALDDAATDYTWKQIDYYQVYCAMYCGTGHSVMLAKCIVQTQADFDRWLDHQTKWEPRLSYVDRGKQLAAQMGCATCHSVDGSRMTGPSWKDLYGKEENITGGPPVHVDDAYIEESILLPSKKIVQTYEDKMPQDFGAKLKPNDITALIWYMKSISSLYKGDMTEGTTVGAAAKAQGAAAGQPATEPSKFKSVPPIVDPPAVKPPQR